MDRPRDYHSKSEKDKYHTILLTCGTSCNRLTDIENKLMVTKGEGGGGGINLEYGISRYTLPYIK